MSRPDFENLPRFELKEALERCMDSMDFLLELADVFVSESIPLYLPRIQEGLENNDFEELTRNAHALKGGSSSIGLIRLKEMAYCLEQAGQDKDRQIIEKILPDLMHEAEEIKHLINNRQLFK